MPPQSSLPLRDGRAGLPPPSSSSFIHNSQLSEPYSDEDIELIHEIVALGESIYPSLPERERLPTNALFLAAEQILPVHGYDPENAPSHISRLIFKIGGQRSGETLSDKFRTVLEGMGIKLEFVPSSPPIRPGSHRLYPLSEEETVEFDLEKRQPRRRVSSISRKTERQSFSDEATYDLPIRVQPRPRSRSVSFVDDQLTAHTEEETRPFSRSDRHEIARRFLSYAKDKPKEAQPVAEDRPITRYRRKPSRVWNWQLQNEQAEAEEEEEEEEVGGVDENDRFGSYIPAQLLAHPEKNNTPDRINILSHAISSSRTFAGSAENGNNKELRTATPSTIADTEPVHRSPGSDDFNGPRGSSDTTVEPQEDDHTPKLPHGERPAVDLAALEAKMELIRAAEDEGLLDDAFDEWFLRATQARNVNTEIREMAAELADNDIVDECLQTWREEAVLLVRAEAMARATAEQEEYVTRMERRAARVYEIFTMTRTLLFWHQEAREEVERTAAARRHLVRKRAFDAWRAQRVEDEAKVANFQLIHYLQTWTQVSFHQEVRRAVAVQRDQMVLARDVLGAMWQTQKARVADDLYNNWLLRNAVATWIAVDNDSVQQEELAIELDERLLLDEAFNIWNEEAIELRLNADQLTIEYFRQEARHIIDDWQEQARLAIFLARFREAEERNERNRILDIWLTALDERTDRITVADNFVLTSPLTIWLREAQLREFQARQIRDLQTNILTDWSLMARDHEFTRYTEFQTINATLNHWRAVATQAQQDRWDGEDESMNMLEYHTFHDVFEGWLDELDDTAFWKHRQNAALVDLYRTTRHLVDHWGVSQRQAVVRRRQADQRARLRIVESVLEKWPIITVNTRRERLMNSLRAFRRHYKTQTARSCLDHWHLAATDYVEFGRDAHNVNIHFRRADINEYLDYWVETARRAEEFYDYAAEAELEVLVGRWVEEAREKQGAVEYAIEYDEDVTLWRCWERWEFQALQVMGRNQMANTVRDRNLTRLCRGILESWYERAFPPAGPDGGFNTTAHALGGTGAGGVNDFRTSVARRSVRGRPGGGASVLGTPGPALAFRNRVGESSRRLIPPPPPPPPASEPAAPETPRFPSVSQLGGNRNNGQGNSMFRPAHQFSTTTTTTTRSRFGLSGRGSVTAAANKDRDTTEIFGPMPEFDDDSFAPDAETNDPGFMSTPTKWTGSARPLGYRPAAAAAIAVTTPFSKSMINPKTTTTPSAILATPYERELRNGYGSDVGGVGAASLGSGRSNLGLKLMRSSLLGRSTTANNTRQGLRTVEFADITEASAEGSSENKGRRSLTSRSRRKSVSPSSSSSSSVSKLATSPA
ncbi:Sfi1 spindle body protein-domain-containing protein [Cladorrhinum sp. PSN259]|nr:Sfi1 spindle body protein-domain-containing protein [Cladorrhinum sp. PSN259]